MRKIAVVTGSRAEYGPLKILMDAIEKFEPERCIRFETYCVQRIRGAILDGLRKTAMILAEIAES